MRPEFKWLIFLIIIIINDLEKISVASLIDWKGLLENY